MVPKYLKIENVDKDVYFQIVDIKKYICYSMRGVDLYDYQITINHLFVYDKQSFEENHNGLFIHIDKNKNVKIYDNVKKEYVNFEDCNDVNYLSYFYHKNTYSTSLENAVKQILFEFFINN
jgi:hypothetical protein